MLSVKDANLSVQRDFTLVSFYIITGQEKMPMGYSQGFTVMIVMVDKLESGYQS